jgi:signal transduction histidine kinase
VSDVPSTHEDRKEAAARLRRLKNEILRHWVARVRGEVPAAEGQSRAVILDHIPHLLDQLAGSLEFASACETEAPAAAQGHADQRAALSDYSLDQVVYEYHLLRRVVMDVLEAESPLPREAQVAVHDGIDAAIQLATTQYVQLQQGELRQRAQELAMANRAREEFLAMLSHEMRNPLAPVMNAVHVMRMIRLENPILQQSLSMIERQMRQMGRLVDDLLDMARITRGKVKLRKEPVEMSVLVERSVETIRPLAQERRHALTVSLPPNPIWLEADPVRIEQVFVNLLTNAVKYTEPGGQIWVTAVREGDSAVVRVKDTGVGIAPELIPRVFDLFSQGERPIDRSQGGLGIGLTLSRTLVEMHGGTVTVHSDGTGEGSEFVVHLPVGAGLGDRVPGGRAEGALSQGRAMRVLVVDDNVDAADSLALLLRLHGHEVNTAHNGQDALEQIHTNGPAVVFLDIGLPGMDGHEVARRLRADEGQPRCLLVAITGYGQDTDREKSREAGFDYHLIKPADPTKVEELLRVLSSG